MKVYFPSPKILREFARLDDTLLEVLWDVSTEYAALGLLSDLLYISYDGIYRPGDLGTKRSGIHAMGPPFRCIDLAMTWDSVRAVGLVVNNRWQYDPRRPEMQVVVTKEHGTGAHAHVQVHPRTRRIRERTSEHMRASADIARDEKEI